MFKKSISIVLSLILLISVFSAASITANAETTYKSGDYTYKLLDEGGVEIINYSGSASTLTIPSQLDGYTVKGIGYRYTDMLTGAFARSSKLQSVTIPNSVTYIGFHAFDSCNSLSKVTFGTGLLKIGGYSFYNCYKLSSVTILPTVTGIGEKAFGHGNNSDFMQEMDEWSGDIDDYGDGESITKSGFTIKGCPNTEAERYAKHPDNSFRFIPMLTETDQASIKLDAGDTMTVSVYNQGNKSVKYISANSKVASVSSKGKITALKEGTAIIIAVMGDKVCSAKVTVIYSPYLSKRSVTVKKGKKVSVEIIGKASAIKNKYYNTKKAKIISKKTASKIKIKGLKKGKTTLKIKVNGVIVLKLKVKVK